MVELYTWTPSCVNNEMTVYSNALGVGKFYRYIRDNS